MYAPGRSRFPALVLLTPTIVITVAVIINPTYAQRTQTTDEPFAVVITLAGVDNSTGFVANWVTANNITRANFYNASDVDLIDTIPNDGFVDTSIVLPNGTLHLGDEFTVCTVIIKDVYLTCDKGFNAPTNRAEFVSVFVPSSDRK